VSVQRSILEGMNAKALFHCLLASLLLVQSIVALANISGSEAASQQTASAAEQGAMPGCHEAAPEAPVLAASDCCESMDQSCCQFGCASFTPAVPMTDIARCNEKRSLYTLVNGPPHLKNTPTGLFRPPRTI